MKPWYKYILIVLFIVGAAYGFAYNSNEEKEKPP